MILSKPKRGNALSHSAMGIALAFGLVAGGVVTAEPAFAQKRERGGGAMKLSPDFQKIAAPLSQAIEAAKAKPEVIAAKGNPAALSAALSSEKAQIDPAFAAATTPEDKFVAGQLAVSLGGVAEDTAMQRRGLQSMVDSGKTSAADLPKFQFFLGQLAFQAKDYAAARTALQAAKSAGYNENDIDALLAEAYINDNQAQQGLAILKQAIDARKAAGQPAPENWYRRGLGVAYKSQQLDQAAVFSMALVDAYPTTQNWGGAITVVREIGKFPAQETLDLARLMARTNSYNEERDYLEHIEAADARRLPGEVQKVIQAGFASGKLNAGNSFVSEQKSLADQRVGPDRASLAKLESDARAASASGVVVAGTADAFLSYGQAGKAEELYTLALSKPGADQARVLTRLGIAQTDQGKFGQAGETFAKVTGPRKPIAQLWALYAAQKAGGGQAAPAAAAPAKPAG